MRVVFRARARPLNWPHVPLQERIEAVTDEGDLEDVHDTERHLLYVACTRARDHLMVSGVQPASEFLEDMQAAVKQT